ncbi:MAG: DNA translocase FtsK 4TM domain-containing protein [Bacteroidia bacterium]|nr:DNA translocase FtsK 4TM domain-containing protein [Bacteroidia bacterium]|tara:strand:+ start:12873 stop:15278 length:2406 start_codon:yes stop_codon:yes gene_type:complete
MAFFNKKSSKSKKKLKSKEPKDYTLFNKVMGSLFFAFALFLSLASISYLFSWRTDQSILNTGVNEFLFDFKNLVPKNMMGKMGALLAHTFIYNGFGIGAFLLYPIFLIVGFNLYFNNRFHIRPKTASKLLVSGLWISLVCSLLFSKSYPLLGGLLGYGIYIFSKSLVGIIGIALILGLVTVFFLYVAFGIDVLVCIRNKRLSSKESETSDDEGYAGESLFEKDQINIEHNQPDILSEPVSSDAVPITTEELMPVITNELEPELKKLSDKDEEDLELKIEEKAAEEEIDKQKQKEHYGIDEPFDPRLDLRDYLFPEIDFLNKYDEGPKTEVSKDDLEKSKNMIVQTLNNYKIGIAQIKATIGPTVTLFEIVPEAGVRISKIKNLEDDIALSLAALGIRIIAPIPGKGTIGIEVPNKKPEIVSMHSVINSAKYQNSDAALPVCLGKTISNEVYVADLAKMPHLLMAGATGQGKSVGLNAIIVSLLYRKHPAELKFVMVDPKKVELTLYQTIERHYLAKLPGEGDAIITDNKQVISTLNSLCEEMDQRYALLQAAMVRNIKEYNSKFIKRKLNPEEGHKYLPYIVVIIDEVADLIMTAGKEVEHPIGRIAQLARAIGIHLILATQRPSVNIITGTIKANFPARIAFRVSSKIDSRTILDGNGADQLIGKGDMLYSTGSDMVRLQCPFVDTPEVDTITGFIGNQRGYPDAHILPEVREESSGDGSDFNADDRDALFEDAARIVVQHQQGSTSLIQRRLKVGYNRAGRLIDQLEAANIVGPFEGSKARSVLLPDEYALEQFLNSIN